MIPAQLAAVLATLARATARLERVRQATQQPRCRARTTDHDPTHLGHVDASSRQPAASTTATPRPTATPLADHRAFVSGMVGYPHTVSKKFSKNATLKVPALFAT